MPVTIPKGVLKEDEAGVYAFLPDGTVKRLSVTVTNGVSSVISTRIKPDGKVEVETEK